MFLVPSRLFAFLSKRPMVGNCVAPARFRRQCAGPCRTAASMRSSSDKGNMVSAGIGSATGLRFGGEHAAFERRAVLARSPHQPYAAKMDRERELKIIRRAYAKQVM